MSSDFKRKLVIAFGLIISVVLIWFLLRDIKFNLLWSTLSQANYFWLIPNILMIILTMYQRAFRWHYMVRPIKKVPFHNLLAATCIGFMANNVLPLRLGEFVRAYSLSDQDKGISKSASLATIFVERMVFDLVALLLIFGTLFLFSEDLRMHVDDQITTGIYLSIGIALVGMVVMVLMGRHPEKMGELISRYLFFIPLKAKDTIKSIILKFSDGLKFLTSFRTALWVGVQTLMIWVLMGLSNVFIFMVFGFDIPVTAAFVLLVVVSISILVPSSPGFVGVYHFAVAWSLAVFGVEKEAAVSCALVLHATQYLVVTLMGFYFLKKEHLSLKKLETAAVEDI